MFECNDNYGKKTTCRLCEKEEESTEHLIVCEGVLEERKIEGAVKVEDIITTDVQRLRELIKWYGKVGKKIKDN